jgi:hypothetical protein
MAERIVQVLIARTDRPGDRKRPNDITDALGRVAIGSK